MKGTTEDAERKTMPCLPAGQSSRKEFTMKEITEKIIAFAIEVHSIC
ncbi:MAG: hypothetical protein ABH952_03070 [Candidatus Omnitrophota bacterium]